MSKRNTDADLDETCVDRWRGVVRADAEEPRSAPDCYRIAGGIGSSDTQQELGAHRELCHATTKALLDLSRQRHDSWHGEPAGELGSAQTTWPLDERERVAERLGDDTIAHANVKRNLQDRAEQRVRIAGLQSLDNQF